MGGEVFGLFKTFVVVLCNIRMTGYSHVEESSVRVSEISKDLSTHSCVISSGVFVTVVLSGQYVCQLAWVLCKLATSIDKNFDSSFWKS